MTGLFYRDRENEKANHGLLYHTQTTRDSRHQQAVAQRAASKHSPRAHSSLLPLCVNGAHSPEGSGSESGGLGSTCMHMYMYMYMYMLCKAQALYGPAPVVLHIVYLCVCTHCSINRFLRSQTLLPSALALLKRDGKNIRLAVLAQNTRVVVPQIFGAVYI